MRSHTICLALGIVLLCPIGSAQWMQTNGPTGGNVDSFAISGTNLFAGTCNGVFLSTNNGTNWTQSGLVGQSISCLSIGDTNLYAGSDESDGGLFSSTDNGSHWSHTGLMLRVTSVESVPNESGGTNLFAGVYRPTPPRTARLKTDMACETSSQAIRNGRCDFDPFCGIVVSTDYGASWDTVASGLTETVTSFCS